jgi:DNA anti-recombination protein RmuC
MDVVTLIVIIISSLVIVASNIFLSKRSERRLTESVVSIEDTINKYLDVLQENMNLINKTMNELRDALLKTTETVNSFKEELARTIETSLDITRESIISSFEKRMEGYINEFSSISENIEKKVEENNQQIIEKVGLIKEILAKMHERLTNAKEEITSSVDNTLAEFKRDLSKSAITLATVLNDIQKNLLRELSKTNRENKEILEEIRKRTEILFLIKSLIEVVNKLNREIQKITKVNESKEKYQYRIKADYVTFSI